MTAWNLACQMAVSRATENTHQVTSKQQALILQRDFSSTTYILLCIYTHRDLSLDSEFHCEFQYFLWKLSFHF